jgi:N6-adenosine-specific RNA methylase IME4
MADPPWKFDDPLPGNGRGAEKYYSCMTLDELIAFPLPLMQSNSLLLLWRVASMQEEALTLMKAWGYMLKSELVWLKLTANGNAHFGMGRYVRAAHETCLIGVRGRFQVDDRSVRSVFEAPVGRHSEKPNEAYRIAERLAGEGPLVEIFSRRRRNGWTCYGNELDEEREAL